MTFQRFFSCSLLILALSAACASPVPTRQAAPVEAGSSNSGSTSSLMVNSSLNLQKSTASSPAAQPQKKTNSTSPAGPTVPYQPADLAFNVILGRPTAHSITLSLYATADMQIEVAYGLAPGHYTTQVPAFMLKANIPQNVELTQLNPDCRYYYQITSNGQPLTEHIFQTQQASQSTFTFTLDADPHNRDPNFNGELYAQTLGHALADHPDFHINLGDTFMTEKVNPQTYTDAQSTFTDMRPYFGILGADVPLFLVNGNHEGELGWLLHGTDKNLPIWSTQLRQLYYPNPQPNGFYTGGSTPDANLGSVRDGYYAWTWGDALFVVLDPFWYTAEKSKPGDLNHNWSWTLGKGQYDWLKTTLQNSQARYKFVFIHNLVGGNDKDARGGIEAAPYFEWGGKNADGSWGFDQQRPGWGDPIHTLLVKNQVSAVFHGHDHVFVKQDLDGIVYQECPQPDVRLYNNTKLAQDYGYLHGNVISSSGYLRVTVSPQQAKVEYVRSYLKQDVKPDQVDGQVVDTYLIKNSIGAN